VPRCNIGANGMDEFEPIIDKSVFIREDGPSISRTLLTGSLGEVRIDARRIIIDELTGTGKLLLSLGRNFENY